MNTQPKKLLIFYILDILKRCTDEDHRLSQKQIGEILEREYEMKADRKSIRRNLLDLIDLGYDVGCSQSVRVKPDGEEEVLLTDWYLNQEFTNSELRILIDGLLFSKHIPYRQCRELVEKLEGLSSQHFRARVRHIAALPQNRPDNRQLFYTIDMLDEAMEKGRQVSFHYCHAGMDHQLRPQMNEQRNPKEYVVNPYQLVAANGRYYLIANTEPHFNVSHYRVDRISDICLLETPVKDPRQVQGLEQGLDLSQHMAEHPYLFAGESVRATFRAKKHLLNDLEDWFGPAANYFHETESALDVTVKVNQEAMFYWALQYAPFVEVLEPAALRQRVGRALREAAEKYETEVSHDIH